MNDVPDPGESPDNPPELVKPSRPKRGAFPTPKSEIEKAKPYIPDVGDDEGWPEGDSDQPASTDGGEED
jgi:hypothetical protein